jgi:hypothetical protein
VPGEWRELDHEELYHLYTSPSRPVIRKTKTSNVRLVWYVGRMGQEGRKDSEREHLEDLSYNFILDLK